MNTVIVIPARMQSTRLPNKPLKQKNGKSLIQHVWEQCKATGHDVYVATDHQDIVKDVESFKGKWIMTDPNIPTGTDRCAEILKPVSYTHLTLPTICSV